MHKIYIAVTLVIGFLLGLGLQQHTVQNLERQILEFKLAEARAKEIILREREADGLFIDVLRTAAEQERQEHEDRLVAAIDKRERLIEQLRYTARAQTCPVETTKVTERGPSKSNQDAFDLFIHLLDRHTRELERVGEYADELRSAGLKCEQISDRQSK